MNRYDCDTVRDLLPLLVRGELTAPAETHARDHVSSCPECRDEAALVRMIQVTLDPLPAGLEARVLTAVRQAAAGGQAGSGIATDPPRLAVAPRRWSPGRLAMAATVAATLIGGALVVERFGSPWSDTPATSGDFDVTAISLLSWVASDDPMLHSGTALQELTVDELELLLAELDS
jgi:anti-sigma factor RsiW